MHYTTISKNLTFEFIILEDVSVLLKKYVYEVSIIFLFSFSDIKILASLVLMWTENKR